MDSGVNGSRGLNAHDLVAVEFKHVDAHALNPTPPTEEKIALVVKTKPDLVTLAFVQVNYSWYSCNLQSVDGILKGDHSDKSKEENYLMLKEVDLLYKHFSTKKVLIQIVNKWQGDREQKCCWCT